MLPRLPTTNISKKYPPRHEFGECFAEHDGSPTPAYLRDDLHGAVFVNGQGPFSSISPTPRQLRHLRMQPGWPCCDFMALEPYLGRDPGVLRLFETRPPRDQILLSIPGLPLGLPFCEDCQIAAQEAVDAYLGLQIKDTAGGRLYQSAKTAQAVAQIEKEGKAD
ncbi:hypothetical protein C8R46DRAFT_294114 [Mycena filopes]|nr:hypothetical protein C8R46DRAFT_294114 [Mycena filopes]